jgi:hypothetical protein
MRAQYAPCRKDKTVLSPRPARFSEHKKMVDKLRRKGSEPLFRAE